MQVSFIGKLGQRRRLVALMHRRCVGDFSHRICYRFAYLYTLANVAKAQLMID